MPSYADILKISVIAVLIACGLFGTTIIPIMWMEGKLPPLCAAPAQKGGE